LTQKDISFLIGAGVSQAAELPGTKDITNAILRCENIAQPLEDWQCFNNDDMRDQPELLVYINNDAGKVSEIRRFMNCLCKVRNAVLQSQSDPNYEDIYYLSNEIRSYFEFKHKNPTTASFINALQPKRSANTDDDLQRLAGAACKFIRDTVCDLLRTDGNIAVAGNLFDQTLQNSIYTSINIFTLNNDTLIERYLQSKGTLCADGFGKSQANGLRFWDPSTFDPHAERIRLFKLHGSIDWYEFSTVQSRYNDSYIAQSTRIPANTYSYKGKTLETTPNLLKNNPLIIIGSFNKTYEYAAAVYGSLIGHFWHELGRTERLIVCGYSFRDFGINQRLIDWISGVNDHRIIIIHPNPEKCTSGALQPILGYLKQSGQSVRWVENRAENVRWSEIQEHL
jgi:hypothetical protein